MGKRSNFKRKARDHYQTTDPKAVSPLIPHLSRYVKYCEPCAAGMALIKNLSLHSVMCVAAYDIKPKKKDVFVKKKNALKLKKEDMKGAKLFITNPPWSWNLLKPILDHLLTLGNVWLLLSADFKHTKQAAPYMRHCRMIVSVGRVKWFKKSKFTGKDNCCWYFFTKRKQPHTIFIGRK